MSFMLMSPAMLSSPKVDARMKKFAEAEVAAEVAAKSVTDPVKSAEAAQAAKQAVLQEIEEADALEEDDSDDEKGVLQTVKDAIVAFDDAVTSGLSKIDQKLGFSAAVHKVDDKLKIGDKALAVAKAADENLIRPVVFGVTRAAGAFKRKLVKKKVVVKKKGSVVKSAALALPSPASDSKTESPSTDDTVMDVDDGQEMKEMTGGRVPSQSIEEKTEGQDGDESEYEEIEVEEEIEVLEEVSDDEATPATATVISSGKPTSSPPTSTPSTSRTATSRTPTSTTTSTVTSPSAAIASSSPSPRQSTSTSSTPRQRRRSSTEAVPDVV